MVDTQDLGSCGASFGSSSLSIRTLGDIMEKKSFLIENKNFENLVDMYAKNFSLKGFRKGHVPKIVVQNLVGKDILDDVIWRKVCLDLFEIYKTKLEKFKAEKKLEAEPEKKEEEREVEKETDKEKKEEDFEKSEYLEKIMHPDYMFDFYRKFSRLDWKNFCSNLLSIYELNVKRISVEKIEKNNDGWNIIYVIEYLPENSQEFVNQSADVMEKKMETLVESEKENVAEVTIAEATD